jgi:hypothetical protein
MIATKPPRDYTFYCEVCSGAGAGAYVITGCWTGYLVAVNGVLTHGLAALKHPAAPAAALLDTAGNVAIICFSLATAQWREGSFACVLVIAVGFTLARRLLRASLALSVLVHVTLAQIPGAVAVWHWCRCNRFQCTS